MLAIAKRETSEAEAIAEALARADAVALWAWRQRSLNLERLRNFPLVGCIPAVLSSKHSKGNMAHLSVQSNDLKICKQPKCVSSNVNSTRAKIWTRKL